MKEEKDIVKSIFNEIYNYINDNYQYEILTVDLLHEIGLSIDNLLRHKYYNRNIGNFWIHLYEIRNSYTLNNEIHVNDLGVNYELGSNFIYQISIKDLNGDITTEYLTLN